MRSHFETAAKLEKSSGLVETPSIIQPVATSNKRSTLPTPPVLRTSSVARTSSFNQANLTVPNAASKRPKLALAGGGAAVSAGTANDPEMARFKEAMFSSNTHMVVFHVTMEGSVHDVWGFTIKDNDNDYWSWKPNAVEKAIVLEGKYKLFSKQCTMLDELLFNVANLRTTPQGPNIAATFQIKGGKSMNKMVSFGFIESPSSEATVRALALEFVKQFEDVRVRTAYTTAMGTIMKSAAIIKDCDPTDGFLWKKLNSAGKNIVYEPLVCLADVFCDNTIENIMQTLYAEVVAGESPSMWWPILREMAFGPPADLEEADPTIANV